jgi:signal transduction histidine kinase
MLSAMNRWFEQNRWAGDAVIAGALMIVLGLASVGGLGRYGGFTLFTVLLVLPLFARRTYPLQVLLVTVALLLIQLVAIRGLVAGDVVGLVVIHTAAAYIPDRRWGYAALGAGIVGIALAIVFWSQPYFDSLFLYGNLASTAMLFLAGVALVGAAYLLGIRQRERRERAGEQLAALAERNRLLTSERDTRVEMGAAAERARIARELHDIVAHSLSVIVVQADGGAAAARSKPELGPQVLETIAATSRDALAQMRRMVSVLRAGPGGSDPSAPDYTPAPGPADLDDLVAQVHAAGLPVTMETIGTPRTMAEDAGLAVYRVVQESLTNVLKHAGPAASCRVVLHYGPAEVVVTVTDDGRGAAAGFPGGDVRSGTGIPGGDGHSGVRPPDDDGTSGAGMPSGAAYPGPGWPVGDATTGGWPYGEAPAAGPYPGHGLEGMRERVTLQGGSVHAGPRTGGGFEVTATVPYQGATPA